MTPPDDPNTDVDAPRGTTGDPASTTCSRSDDAIPDGGQAGGEETDDSTRDNDESGGDSPEVSPEHATYPFTDDASDLVNRLRTTIEQAAEGAVGDRGVERVEQAVANGDVGTYVPPPSVPPDERRRVELLSYPVARLIVSAVGFHPLINRYANAEAERCVRAAGDVVELAEAIGLSVERLNDAEGGRELALPLNEYVDLAPLEDHWILARREIRGGQVTVAEGEVEGLARRRIERAVADRLPLEVAPALENAFEDEINHIRQMIGEMDPPDVDGPFEPEALPPRFDEVWRATGDPEEAVGGDGLFALALLVADVGADREDLLTRPAVAETPPARDIVHGAFDAEMTTPRYAALPTVLCPPVDEREHDHPITAYAAAHGERDSKSDGDTADDGDRSPDRDDSG